jgi:ATP-dependent exoDNAse (exonuclease V) beta subunit
MTALRNEMIMASAGSGKTYRLTNRYIRLLALGVPPERIVALTFTRKAAAEFLEEILAKLARAGSDASHAARLGRDLGIDGLDPGRARDLLRQVVDQLHLVTLGTLDAFFHRILACFPAEFGLTTGFEVLDPAAEAEARLRVFDGVFANRRLHASFTEAFKRATFGAEEKFLLRRLDRFVLEHHRTYLRQPQAARWGEERAIWPQGCRWLRGVPDIDLACRELSRALDDLDLDDGTRKAWDDLLAVFAAFRPGTSRPDKAKTLLERIFDRYAVIRAGGPVTLTYNRKTHTYPPQLCHHLAGALDHFCFAALHPELQRTRGLHRLLELFERDYHQLVRRSGQLGFEDLQMLLNGTLQPPDARTTLSLDGGEGRLHVDYRLDGQFDHWLLDEFQDTSPGQWQVISNLIDEVMQDDSGRRSLFYVGDVKQAIYGWRGGDAALFEDIRDHFESRRPGSIVQDHMEESWRSGPRLIDAVNRVFGDASRLRDLFPDHPDLARRWEAAWQPHGTRFPDRADHVALLALSKPSDPEDALPLPDRRRDLIRHLLERIAPHRRRLSCVVLVRKNESAHALADHLRAHTDLPVTVESDARIGTDHPVATSFLSLLHYAAHPGDSVAWKHLCMTPALCAKSWKDLVQLRRDLVSDTLGTVHDSGFRGAFERWLARLREGGFVPDAFAWHRIRQLRRVTHAFDQTGNRSIPAFLRHAEHAATRETPAEGVVQIMTVHKAKGLTFDVAVLAEIDGDRDTALTSTGALSVVAHESGAGLTRDIDWVLSMPPKDICALDPALSAASRRLETDRGYEELCVLYVALTRARHATYLVCGEPAEANGAAKGSARDLVFGALAGPPDSWPALPDGPDHVRVAYAAGPPDWFSAWPERSAAPAGTVPDVPAAPRPVTARRRFLSLRRAVPSGLDETEAESPRARTRFLLSRSSRDAAAYGTKVHELFEVIAWRDDLGPRGLSDLLDRAVDPSDPMDLQVRDEILHAFQRPEIDAVFRRASFGPEPRLWREKRFEIILGDAWVSGTFDRVVLAPDRAWIYDFKTNRVSTPREIALACESYAAQLSVYRRALARLAAIPADAIRTFLVFTKPGTVEEVLP